MLWTWTTRRIDIDHVGLGSDFDGLSSTTHRMEDVSTYPRLFEELAKRGYSQAMLEKLEIRNMLRVLRGRGLCGGAPERSAD